MSVNPLSAERAVALLRKYATETVSVQRTTGRGTALTTAPVATDLPAYRIRLRMPQAFPGQGGQDILGDLRFHVDSATDILPGDVLVDAAGIQYRVLQALRTLPGAPLAVITAGVT